MTVKMMAFLKAKAGMTRAEFVEYYETRHVALIRSIMPGILLYRRNYLDPPAAGFDVVTEMRFADRTSYDAAMRAATDDIARISADEENFLDHSATQVCLAEEKGGPKQ